MASCEAGVFYYQTTEKKADMKPPTDEQFLKIRCLEQNGKTRDEAWKQIMGYTAAELNGVKAAPASPPVKKPAKKAPAKNGNDPLL